MAISQRGEARDAAVEARNAARSADAQRLGAIALSQRDFTLALLLARQGMALQDSPQTRSNLLATLLKSPAAVGILRGDGDRLLGLDLSPDGRTLAFVDVDGTLTFKDTRTRRTLGAPAAQVPGLVGYVIDADVQPNVVFSPDGSLLAVGGGLPTVYGARTHRRIARLRVPPNSITYGLTFSPDGRELIGTMVRPGLPGTDVRSFDPRSGRPLGPMREIQREPGIVPLMVTSNGRRLLTVSPDEGTVIWDAGTLAPVRRVPVRAEAAALAPNDRTMLAGGDDGSVRFVDLETGKVLHGLRAPRERGLAGGVQPRRKGRRHGSDDGHLIVWDVATRTVTETLAGHAQRITGLAFSPDGATLYSSALDGKVFIWDLSGTARLGRRFAFGTGNDETGIRYALSSDGSILAAGNGNGTVTLIDARTLKPSGTIRIARGVAVQGMAFAPGGHLLVAGDQRGLVSLVDADRQRVVKRWRAQRDGFYNPGVSADGRVLGTASRGTHGSVRAWALPSGAPLGPRRDYGDNIGDIDLSPDGRTLAVTDIPDSNPAKGGVDLLDVPSMRRRARLAQTSDVWDLVSFTPDGRYLVGGSWKGWVRLWSTRTWKPVTRQLTGHAGRVEFASMGPDGRTLATGGQESAIRLWDTRTQQPFGAPLPALEGYGVAPQFSPDGAHLFALTEAGVGYRWDVRPASWARYACAVAGRRLTRAEWQDALPGRPYAPAC